jgi:hypothetical protein
MLDEKDLQAIQTMVETVVNTRAAQTEKLMDDRFLQTEKLIESRAVQTEKLIESRAVQTESFLLDELSRTQNILEKRIEAVKKNMEELSQYYRIAKLEGDNTALLLQMINDLRKEVDELKQKIA